MSLRNRFVLMSVLATLAVLMGCSSTHKAAPPPTGAFGDGNLKGAYVFSIAGTDVSTGTATPFAVVGVLNADGAGGISGGTIDINDPALGAFTSGALAPYWLFVLGSIFVFVTLILPKGIVGTMQSLVWHKPGKSGASVAGTAQIAKTVE